MSTHIRILGYGMLTTSYKTIYEASTGTGEKTSGLLVTLRLVNTDTVIRTVRIRLSPGPVYFAPKDLKIEHCAMYVDDSEMTFAPGEKIEALADNSSKIDFIASGLETDM